MSASKDADIAAVPLSKSWPEPDYQKLVDDGADPWTVAFVHSARRRDTGDPRAVYDHFFNTIQSKETESGVALFSAQSTATEGETAEAVRAAIAGDTFDHEVDVYATMADAPDYVQQQAMLPAKALCCHTVASLLSLQDFIP